MGSRMSFRQNQETAVPFRTEVSVCHCVCEGECVSDECVRAHVNVYVRVSPCQFRYRQMGHRSCHDHQADCPVQTAVRHNPATPECVSSLVHCHKITMGILPPVLSPLLPSPPPPSPSSAPPGQIHDTASDRKLQKPYLQCYHSVL